MAAGAGRQRQGGGVNMPVKRLILILSYMAFIFCVIIVLIHYAARHPLEDKRARQEQTR